MRITLTMPKVGDAADKVLVAPAGGDRVSEGQMPMLVAADKAKVEAPSPTAGTVTAVHVAEGDEVATGAPTFAIEG
jgi:pyruvate/2-oxoglutarate dehydrogenase complex dihydrolipoamide acyltransferase (E2) component